MAAKMLYYKFDTRSGPETDWQKLLMMRVRCSDGAAIDCCGQLEIPPAN